MINLLGHTNCQRALAINGTKTEDVFDFQLSHRSLNTSTATTTRCCFSPISSHLVSNASLGLTIPVCFGPYKWMQCPENNYWSCCSVGFFQTAAQNWRPDLSCLC